MIDVYALGYHHSYYDLETYFQVKKKKAYECVICPTITSVSNVLYKLYSW